MVDLRYQCFDFPAVTKESTVLNITKITTIAALALMLSACGSKDEEETCESGATACADGGASMQTCVDGVWGEAEACATGKECMEMGGTESCMNMEGDDDMDDM